MQVWELVGRDLVNEMTKQDPLTLGQYVAAIDFLRAEGTYFNFGSGDAEARNALLQRAMRRWGTLTEEEQKRATNESLCLLLPVFGSMMNIARQVDKPLGKAFERYAERLRKESRKSMLTIEPLPEIELKTEG